MIDHIDPASPLFDIPSHMRRVKGEKPRRGPRTVPKFKMPKKAKPKAPRRKGAKPTRQQEAFLREMGYTVKKIKRMSQRRAQHLIDNQVPPHMESTQ